jgi:hypothetical protein
MDRAVCFLWLFTIYNRVLALPPRHAAPEPNFARDAPIVSLLNGSYFGIHSDQYQQDFFLGIPFAQPPMGDLRFRLPASLNSSWTGVRNATQYSPACFGYGEDTQIGAGNYCSEDCLTLNIVRPSGYGHQKLPIAVWIYGLVHDFSCSTVMVGSVILNIEAGFMKVQIVTHGIICHLSSNNRLRLVSPSLQPASITAFKAGGFCTLRMF